MRYAAELYQIHAGERRTLETTMVDAATDQTAIERAREWAAPLVHALSGEVHMQLTQDQRGWSHKVRWPAARVHAMSSRRARPSGVDVSAADSAEHLASASCSLVA